MEPPFDDVTVKSCGTTIWRRYSKVLWSHHLTTLRESLVEPPFGDVTVKSCGATIWRRYGKVLWNHHFAALRESLVEPPFGDVTVKTFLGTRPPLLSNISVFVAVTTDINVFLSVTQFGPVRVSLKFRGISCLHPHESSTLKMKYWSPFRSVCTNLTELHSVTVHETLTCTLLVWSYCSWSYIRHAGFERCDKALVPLNY